MEPLAAENQLTKSPDQQPLRDFLQRPPGNVVKDSSPSLYLKEFLDFQRPAYRPDGRGTESNTWLSASTENIYKSVHKKDAAKTPEEAAESYSDDATKSLKKGLRDGNIRFTMDGAAPKVSEYQNNFRVTEKTTAKELASATLGANAAPEQVDKFAATIVSLNKLEAADKEIAEGRRLKLPGQQADGGITYSAKGTTYTSWHDGSKVEQSERGQGKATYNDRAAGCEVNVSWDPEEKKNCTISKTYEERRIETDANGVRSERLPPDYGLKSKVYNDENERRVSMEFNPKDSKLLRINVQDWKAGTLIEVEPDDKGLLKGKKTDKSGDVIASIQGRAEHDTLVLYEVKKQGDVVTRTFENGTVEEYKADKLTKRTGKDDWGRKVEEVLQPAGKMPPYKVHITLNDNADDSKKTKLTFNRTDYGEYWGQTQKDGKVDLRYQLRASGQIMFSKGQKAWSDLKDGTHLERSQIYDPKDPKKVAGCKISQAKDGATYTVTADRDGNIQSDKYSWSGKDAREVERTRSTNGRLLTNIKMSESNGHKTDFNFDTVSGMFTGHRVDKEGKVVEDVVIADDKILYTSPNGNRRIEVFNLQAQSLMGKKPQSGIYDVQRGTESFRNDDESLSVHPVAGGRTDKVKEDYCVGRTLSGTTIRGERSIVTPDQTVIHNPDGSGARLNADLTVDRWGAEENDNAFKEPLHKAESKYLEYLKDNGQENNVDLRDFLEIHRQFANRKDGAEAINKFYTSLKTLDTAKHLSPDEAKALRINIMHDVAHPEEIDQSRSPTCNTEVIRREMAMNCPDEYVKRFHAAMSDGKVPIFKVPADGAYGSNTAKADDFVSVDPENLKLADCTGRNLAARIFDNMSIQISAQPDYDWITTEDGLGKFIPKDKEQEPKEFSGMQMGDIADVLTKLTGVKRGVLQLNEIEDLSTAFKANGERSMIVGVNAGKAPFNYERIDWDYDELYTNHVVSLTNVFEKDGSTFVNFMNQWGLEADHSTDRTKVRVESFFNNMTGVNSSWRGTRPMTPPQVISAGDPGKVYKIIDGKIVEDLKYTIKDGRVQER
ncbi:MAG: hypothetical protein SGJ27_29485 [Candidatus Melainabacteria bacterium]|nr:hypothetical protein [Candidatus Melainabacteria bacterium]